MDETQIKLLVIVVLTIIELIAFVIGYALLKMGTKKEIYKNKKGPKQAGLFYIVLGFLLLSVSFACTLMNFINIVELIKNNF